MPNVLAFGAFDGFHDGHKFFLDKAASHGNLIVVVARNITIIDVKGRPPIYPEDERRLNLIKSGYNAVLGGLEDKYSVVKEYAPDIICLGYDQLAFTEDLEERCQEFGLKTKILRVESYKPEIYKSSLINANPHKL